MPTLRQFLRFASIVAVIVPFASAQTRLRAPILKSSTIDLFDSSDGAALSSWDKGFLIVPILRLSRADGPRIDVYKGQRKVVSLRPTVPDVAYSQQYAAAIRSAAGDSVVSTSLWTRDGKLAAALMFYDPNGKLEKIVRTNPFLALELVVAPDGSIWGFGVDVHGEQDIDTVQRFDSSGKLVGTYVRQSSFGIKGNPAEHGGGALGRTFAVASRTSVGIYSAPTRQWLEFSLDGRILGRWSVPPPSGVFPAVNFLALSAEGEVFGWFGTWPNAHMLKLDRRTSAWMNSMKTD